MKYNSSMLIEEHKSDEDCHKRTNTKEDRDIKKRFDHSY